MRYVVYLILGIGLIGYLLPEPETQTSAARQQTPAVTRSSPTKLTEVAPIESNLTAKPVEKPETSDLTSLGISPDKEGVIVQPVAAAPSDVIALPMPVEEPEPIAETRYVTASALNMRDQPSTAGQVIAQVRYGDTVDVSEDLGDWSKVAHSGETLWVASRYLSATKPAIARPIPAQATAPRRNVSVPTSSEIQTARNAIIRQSRASYAGSCPCPYDTDRAGRRCGGRSAWSRPGGASPICYDGDISPSRLESYFARLR